MVAVLLPPPFPSTPGYTATDLSYVELSPPAPHKTEQAKPAKKTVPSMGQLNMLMGRMAGKISLYGKLSGIGDRIASLAGSANTGTPSGKSGDASQGVPALRLI